MNTIVNFLITEIEFLKEMQDRFNSQVKEISTQLESNADSINLDVVSKQLAYLSGGICAITPILERYNYMINEIKSK